MLLLIDTLHHCNCQDFGEALKSGYGKGDMSLYNSLELGKITYYTLAISTNVKFCSGREMLKNVPNYGNKEVRVGGI